MGRDERIVTVLTWLEALAWAATFALAAWAFLL